jgi:hypothetical protein
MVRSSGKRYRQRARAHTEVAPATGVEEVSDIFENSEAEEKAALAEKTTEPPTVELFPEDGSIMLPAESGSPLESIDNTPEGYVRELCGAQKRKEGWADPEIPEFCGNLAGFRTDHFGSGRCYLHGGVAGRPAEHGRYSAIHHESIQQLIDLQKLDSNWLDTRPEVDLARATVTSWFNDYNDWIQAIIAWEKSYQKGENPKPPKIMELQDGIRHLDTISKMVERVHKAQAMNAISRPDMLRIVGHMMRVVNDLVENPETKAMIAKEWRMIHI